MAYLTLGDAMAAVVWRQWDIDAISLDDGGHRRPLVARILVGNQQLLSPENAMSLCRAGIQDVVGPHPGQVGHGAALPMITAGQLTALAEATAPGLDEGARQETGLKCLIAAALRDQFTALSVQLPAHEMGAPTTGPQVLLLWGLWRTTQSLLAGADVAPADVGRAGVGRWSFSTYEPALEAKQTRGLAAIVFRVQQPSQQPWLVRPEATVLPRDHADPAAQDDFDAVAASLAAAYGTMGCPEFVRTLDAIASAYPALPDRLAAAYQLLDSRKGPASDVSARQITSPAPPVGLPVPWATGDADLGEQLPHDWPEGRRRTVSAPRPAEVPASPDASPRAGTPAWHDEPSAPIAVAPIAAAPIAGAPSASRPSSTRRRRPLWQIFVAGQRTAEIASILAWLCLLLIFALVLSLLHLL